MFFQAATTNYPQGTHFDEIEWELTLIETEPYEYEGQVKTILEAAQAYQRYLDARPTTPQKDEVLLKIAKKYYMAWEAAQFNDASRYSKEEIDRFRSKALELYETLIESENLEVRINARISRYHLIQNYREYVNPTAPF